MPYPTGPVEMPDTANDRLPGTVATPEGDNEFAPDQPLPGPSGMPTPERPRGNEPHPEQPIRPAQS